MDIDFVVLWVDGNDSEWLAEKARYSENDKNDSNAIYRFRDWGLMRYWFRGVEKYCPWVRKVHFVTCGHVPSWLNIDHPKLNHVKHRDYIPEKYLPTFNANAIEMNVHKITGLSDYFVFFNDDMFLLRPVTKEYFFRHELPCTYGGENPFILQGNAGIWQHLITNDLRTINNHFDKRDQVRKYGKKYVNSVYRWQDNVRTKLLEKLYPESFLGFKNLHAPASFLKNTFDALWEAEYDLLDQTCSHRFRTNDDLNQWLAIWWQVADGMFAPHIVDNAVSDISMETIDTICEVIQNQKHDMICVNDPSDTIDFQELSVKLQNAFHFILPEKSSFEKYE